jgi:hypothetical protein
MVNSEPPLLSRREHLLIANQTFVRPFARKLWPLKAI